jgi:hypothetical protein
MWVGAVIWPSANNLLTIRATTYVSYHQSLCFESLISIGLAGHLGERFPVELF